jgi:uncharacterized protein YjdB/subtilisin family serine protease
MNKKIKRILAFTLLSSMVFSMTLSNVDIAYAQSTNTEENVVDTQSEEEGVSDTLASGEMEIEEVNGDDYDINLTKDGLTSAVEKPDSLVDEDEMVSVIIVMEEDSIIDDDADAVMNFRTKRKIKSMENKQNDIIEEIEDTVLDGEELDVRYHYTWLLNGIATDLPYGAIDEVEAMDGVESVLLQPVYEVCDTVDTSSISTQTVGDGSMIGREDAWNLNYTGEGMKIAIIDTGLDIDHQNFGALADDVEVSATEDTVASVLSDLNASTVYDGLSASDVYRNSKVAYAFNYVDGDLDVTHDNDSAGYHGTHVAGIAAANKVDGSDVVGTAPDAQLYIMKVFGKAGGAFTEDIVAALEDAMILGADVANLSLGSVGGFTDDLGEFNEIYAKAAESGMTISISAGNAATTGEGNNYGLGQSLTSNPDNATISSPSTQTSALSVASVENVVITGYGIKVGTDSDAFLASYSEGTGGTNASVSTIFEQNYNIVAVPGYGEEADYEGLDVTGKVVLVSRGSISFVDKCANAEAAGAVACIIYNNVTGTIGMDLSSSTSTIPCMSIAMSDGARIISALEENPDLQLTFPSDVVSVDSDTAYQMSDFSSWGVTPDLKLKPEITAPGGNIYSTITDGEYESMSGTSMAAPNLSGIAALVKQYVKENGLCTDTSVLNSYISSLLMSTATPLTYDAESNLLYSPRSQGAGLANAYNAITTRAYLSATDNDIPKAELGDDPEETGNYDFTYQVTNFGDDELYYALDTTVQTEGVNTDYEEYGYDFMSSTPYALDADTTEESDALVYTYDINEDTLRDSHDAFLINQAVTGNTDDSWKSNSFRYDLNGDDGAYEDDVYLYLNALVGNEEADLDAQVLKVEAGETVDVAVSVSLNESAREYIHTYYENGIYVEGFTMLDALNDGGVDLSMPYLAFYGSWDSAPVIDNGYYWDYYAEDYDEDTSIIGQWSYVNTLWSQYGGEESSWWPGLNPYVDEAFDIAHISLSPNEDGYADYIDDIYASMLRNAKTIDITFSSVETGEEYFKATAEDVTKTYSGGYPFVASWYTNLSNYQMTDADGETLANNEKVNLSVAATIDYEGATADTWDTVITIDTEAPELLSATTSTETETVDGVEKTTYWLELTFKDNVSVAGVNLLNSAGTNIFAQEAAPDSEATVQEDGSLLYTQKYDITGLGNRLMVVLGDYALNESYYTVSAPGNDPELDMTSLYGYRVADSNISTDELYGWIGIGTESKTDDGESFYVDTTVYSSEYYMDYALTAAEQVGGYIIAVDANKTLCWIKPGYWDERTTIATLEVGISDMAYDITTDTLYALTSGSAKRLVTIDVETGELNYVGSSYISSAYALTCDNDGNLYGVYGGMEGMFRSIDKETGKWGENLLTKETGMPYAYYSQSMTYDRENDCIYWAQYSYVSYGALYRLSKNEEGAWSIEYLGQIAGDAEIVGLLYLTGNDRNWESDSIESLTITPDNTSLLVGGTDTLTALQTPWYVESELTWSSSDESIATVTDAGVVKGISVGTVTITASTGDVSATATVKVVDPDSELYGFDMTDTSYTIDNQWVSFNAGDTSNYQVLTDTSTITYTAAEYVNGYVYAYDENMNFYRINPSDYSATKVGSVVGKNCQMYDMAYDYSTGFMYGLLLDNTYGPYLVSIDTQTGCYQMIDMLTDNYDNAALTLAVDNDGLIYFIAESYGFLCTYNVDTYETTQIGLTGYTPASYLQSMTFDHDTNELYWASMNYEGYLSLMYMNVYTGKAIYLGNVGKGGSQITGLYTVPENAPETAYVEVESVSLTEDAVNLVVGATATTPVEVLPYNATDRAVTWEVADESIATIDGSVITGVAEGTTTATGTVGGFTVELTINVLASSGTFRAFTISEFLNGYSQFWTEQTDATIETPGQNNYVAFVEGDNDYVFAGAYYNGKVYAYGQNDDGDCMWVLDADTFEEIELFTDYDNSVSIMDMTFDYSEGAMYAVGSPRNTTAASTLYNIDLSTGEFHKVADCDRYVLAMACSEDGQIYGVDNDGALFTINKRTGATTVIGYTGYEANGYNTMAFSYETGNLYWAQCNYDFWSYSMEAAFLLVNTEDASVVNLGVTNAQLSSLFFVTENEPEVGDAGVASIALNQTSLMLSVDETAQLTGTTLPVSVNGSSDVTFTFESSNPEVATVDAEGNVTAVAAGSATITVACNGVYAYCAVNVVDDSTLLYAFGENGWENSALLGTDTIIDTATLAEETGLTIAQAAYNSVDGFVYALDENGCLWAMTLDLKEVKKLSETSILDTLSYSYSKYIYIVDLAYNPYNDTLYAMLMNDYSYEGYIVAIYVDEDGVLTTSHAGYVADNIIVPNAFTFDSATTYLVYDSFYDYIYRGELGADTYTDAQSVLWVQQSVASGESLELYYSASLQRLLFVTNDDYYHSGENALYIVDLVAGTITEYGDGAWKASDMKGIFLIEGADPVETLPVINTGSANQNPDTDDSYGGDGLDDSFGGVGGDGLDDSFGGYGDLDDSFGGVGGDGLDDSFGGYGDLDDSFGGVDGDGLDDSYGGVDGDLDDSFGGYGGDDDSIVLP